MPNTPIQVANIELPGAEYLSLPPNQTIASSGRRRALNFAPNVAIPANSLHTFSTTTTLENPFPPNSAIYLVDTWVNFVPGDQQGLVHINSARSGINLVPGNTNGYDLGIPTMTTLAPCSQQVGIRDQEKLITYNDMAFISGVGNVLSWNVQVVVTNTDAAGPHNFSIVSWIIYHMLNGVIE